MPRHVGEVAVRCFLWAVEPEPREAGAGEHRDDSARADAMQRRVEDGDVARAGGRLAEDGCHERRIDLILDESHAPGGDRGGEVGPLDGVDRHHPVDDPAVVRGEHLDAAGPINLDGVVAGGVVARRHHDPAGGASVADGKRQLGRASVAAQEEDPEAGGQEDLGAELGEMFGAVPGVIGDGAGWRRAGGEGAADIVGEPLGALADRSVVDGVGADREHRAAAASGAKGNHGPVGVVEILPGSLRRARRRGPVDEVAERGSELRVAGFGEPDADRLEGVIGEGAGGVRRFNRGETGGEHGWRGLRGWEGGTVRERRRRFILLVAFEGTARIIPGP